MTKRNSSALLSISFLLMMILCSFKLAVRAPLKRQHFQKIAAGKPNKKKWGTWLGKEANVVLPGRPWPVADKTTGAYIENFKPQGIPHEEMYKKGKHFPKSGSHFAKAPFTTGIKYCCWHLKVLLMVRSGFKSRCRWVLATMDEVARGVQLGWHA